MDHYYYDQLEDSQILQTAKLHTEKFNQAWRVVMANHYLSGIYIDAEVEMNKQYSIIGRLERYIYNFRPSALHDAFLALES